MRASDLIASERNFCRGNFAVDTDSINATFTFPGINPETGGCKAVKWDLQGALMRCYEPAVAREITELARKRLVERNANVGVTGRGKVYANLAEFNDMAPFKDVIEFLIKLEDAYETK